MNSVTETIKIIPYHEGLAKSIADMWNESRESWGGDASVKTEAQVKEQEANSEDLFLYLALDGEKVIGYCGISEYKEDINALYIRLLNVHPDYHGKKIGKQLVLKAVEKTVELGFPRIDLYTWAGNVKAVPLYKKCGFFWEDRDETTHLMNFIPLVLQSEWTKQYFEHLDWYKDNVREIEVKPDGIKANGFTYFEYVWKNETHFLRVQIEKSGRGIRLIETNDIFIEASLNEHIQIEGRETAVKLVMKSKSGKPMKVTVEGQENERIQVKGKHDVEMGEEQILSLPVHILDGDEPNEWVTHPRAELMVCVDGFSTPFAIGLFPKKALKINTVYMPKRYDLNKNQYLYLELENHLKKDVQVEVELPENSHVQWESIIYKTTFSEKGILKIPFTIQKYGFLQAECRITVLSDDEKFVWMEPLAISLPSFGVKAGGYDKEFIYLQNGYNKVRLRKRNNALVFGNETNKDQRTALLSPKFGKPYIGELSKKQVSHFEWEYSEYSATMKLYYDVHKPFAMKLVLCCELFGDGLLNYWMEVENQSDKQVTDVYIYQPVQHHLQQTYMPLKNEVVYFNDAKMSHYGLLNKEEVTGNWMFSDDRKDPHGIAWDPTVQIGFEGWYFYLEEQLGVIGLGEKVSSKPIRFSLGAIKTVEEFQTFAGNLDSIPPIAKETELRTELSNPVMKNNQKRLFLQRIQNRYFNGKLTLWNNGEKMKEIPVQCEDNQDLEVDLHSSSSGFIPIEYHLESESQKVQGSLLLLHQTSSETNELEVNDGKHVSYELVNGDLSFKMANSFFPTLYSLTYKGEEWLDSAYPEPEPKAWWNPWAGGIRTYLSGISLFSFLKETSQARFVKRIDQKQNEWQGLVMETKIENHEKWKGLRIQQYFLTLPGVPMVVHFTELEHADRNINEYLVTEKWWKHRNLRETIIQVQNKSGSGQFSGGIEEQDFRISNPYTVTNRDSTQYLQIYTNTKDLDSDCIFSEQFAMTATADFVNIEPGVRHTTNPVFLLFPQKEMTKEMLESLKNIRF
ncbi:GNAT family N-acetyltransferase [Bacillus sp. FJAT-49736]|uniref:GNAT family N-acetyltransferase n=1 Tax=Bacillus sp. FJAT-49736 TaxID=2833582 RepID=UPI001BC99BB1|nr:GNAT family N-acetyltransferase [Bacillus sp. FJAT-49736]MBS4172834.1 GNAT family N-acetyltransferase [Bacillus sp. FJAT-49736]